MQGIKRKRRCQNQCQQHLFSLKNLKNNSKYDIELTFCPKYQRQPLPPEHTFAEYNNDGLFYTSAFVLGVDIKTITKNLQKEMLDHQKLIKENCEKYNQIVFPRPNSKHITCSVCKETYKNYYTHIFSDEHGEKIQASPYNVCLQQLCSLFKPLWEGCAEKADVQALKQSEKSKSDAEKRVSEELNLDDILEQEDINSNPSRISKFLQDDEEEEQEEIKEVVMKRPVRQHEPPQPPRIQKVYEDRESRKKNINFAAFFEDEPKKRIINDNREAVSISSKKTHKTSSITEAKSKQRLPAKKEFILQDNDPFIIEYNVRSKRKQKKSYYYLKKKQRQEKEQRERQLALQKQNQTGLNLGVKKQSEYEQQISNQKSEQSQNNISQSEEQEYQKYLDQFHEDQKKVSLSGNQIKKTFSTDLKLFEEVQKKPFSNPLFQTFSNPIQQKNVIQKIQTNQNFGRIPLPENSFLASEVYPLKKVAQNGVRPALMIEKKGDMDNEQKQQIIDKNKINYSQQNELPLFHKLKNPIEKDIHKQQEVKTQKPTQEVFNEYEQKIRQYQKQKDYNLKYKLNEKLNPFQQKRITQFSANNDQTTVRMNKSYIGKEFDETYHYGAERNLNQQSNELKTEAYNTKYNNFSQAYYKKSLNEKQLASPLPLNHLLPGAPYSNLHQFYPPYGYPISPYTYPLHEAQKGDRPPLKYGQQREHQSFERGYYYSSWQHPYYMPPPPGTIVPQSNEVEGPHKNLPNTVYNASKGESKQMMYSPYPPFAGYPPGSYPGYYHPSGTPYPPNQRPEYSHNPSNMRIPPQPNTSININFPMYLPPYHGSYPYQPNSQRYSGQPSSTSHSSQYIAQNPSQMKTTASQYQTSMTGGLSSLPPYAEYQEYKKRENERRR